MIYDAPGNGIYNAPKHAVVSLSETLYQELAMMGAKVKVPVLCPAWVKTQIMEAEQHRPAELQNDSHTEFRKQGDPAYQQILNSVRNGIQSGISCEQVADRVLGAIKDEKFYILTHPEWKNAIQIRMDHILQE